MKRTAILSALILAAFILPATATGEHNIDNLGMMAGLSNGYVVSITQDPTGYIWVATEDGLNRFDGSRFTAFRKENSGLGANEFNCVAQIPSDPDHLWIATQRNGIYRYTHSTGEITPFDAKGIDDGAITSITPASDNGIWLTNFHAGVQYYNPATGEARIYNRTNIPGLPPRFWTAVEGPDGLLYVGHEKGGFSVIDTIRHKAVNYVHTDGVPSIPGNQVYTICIDSFNNVWLGTDLGAALYNPMTERIIPFVHNDSDNGSIAAGRVRDIKQLENGEIWFATSQGGVSILDPQSIMEGMENARFRTIPPTGAPKGTSNAYARTIFQDSFGNVWIGNYRTGIDVINHIDPPIIRVDYMTERDNRLNYKPTWSCDYSREGSLWIGGENEIARLKNGKIDVIPLPKSATDGKTFVKAIKADSRGRIWIGTYDRGAMLYNPDSGSFTDVEGLPSDVRTFTEDMHGNIWTGADGGVFICENGAGKAKRVDRINQKLYDHVIQSIIFDKKGNIWIGSFGKGIAVFNRALECLTHLEEATGFPSNAVNAMRCDSKGKIWIATRTGLLIIPNPAKDMSGFTKVEAAERLGISHVKALVEDNCQHIWASTNLGLARIDNGGTDATLYEISESLPLHTFMENASAADSAGNIYFASGNGLFSITPQMLENPVKNLPVYVTGFTVFKEGGNRKENEINLPVHSDRITLGHNQNTFKISFNILDHAMTRTTDFAYKMDGIDKVWIVAGNRTDALFRNLAPGTYRFMVKQRQKGHEWSEPATILTIRINPPLWLRWWAKAIYAAIGAIVLVTGIIFYKNRIKLKQELISLEENSRNKQKLNEERLRFYTNITHELRTPLTLILGPLEDLVSDPSMPPQHSLKLQMIRDSSISLLNMINGILEFRKTETQNRHLHVRRGNLPNLIREIGLRFKELNHNRDVEIILDIEDLDKEIFFDPEMITTIVNNLMSNAVKYTDKGTITLSCRTIEENGARYTAIAVADTGQGISEEGLKHVFERYYQAESSHQTSGTGIGLAIVKNLAELHHALISVESKPGKGSVFTLRITTDNIYPDAIHDDGTQTPLDNEGAHDMPEKTSDKIRVLVVDDNPEIMAYISQALASEFDVEVAKNGIEGIRKVQDKNPDIVVSDIMMPEMDGIALCRMIKDDIQTSHIPVILLTAKDSITDKEEGYAAGANSYLTKPFSAKLLTTRIHNLLRVRKAMAEKLMNGSDGFTPPDLENVNNQNVEQQSSYNEVIKPENALTQLDHRFVEKLVEIINDNLTNKDLNVAFLSNKLCMSPSTLYRKLNSLMGVSTIEFIRRVRFARVKELITEGKLSITEIALTTGFAGHSVFAKAFKKEFGMSATDFANMMKGSKHADAGIEPEVSDKNK